MSGDRHSHRLIADTPKWQQPLKVVRRHRLLFAVCAILVPIVAFVLSERQPRLYVASAQLLFRDPQLADELFGSSTFSFTDPQRQAATNDELAALPEVARRTARALGHGITEGQVSGEVSVVPNGDADLVTINVTDVDPKRAALIANTYGQQFVSFRQQSDRAKVQQAVDLLQAHIRSLPPAARQGAEGRDLISRAQQLEVLASLQTGNAELVQTASPPALPTSPRPKRNAILGAMLGVVLGFLVAFLRDQVDRRLKDVGEVQDIFRRPVLTAVPQSSALSSERLLRLPAREAESFRMLRANLRYFNVSRDVRVVAVTSGTQGEGKTTVTMQLAAVAAEAGERVLLLEADLRRPVLADRLRIDRVRGLTSLLAGAHDLPSAIQQVAVAAPGSGQSALVYDVLPGGPVAPNPTELMESDRMREVLDYLRAWYDMIVIDTSPVTVVSDAIPLVLSADGVVLVTRLGSSTRDTARELRDQMENMGARVLGVVVNSVDVYERYDSYATDYALPLVLSGQAATVESPAPLTRS